MNEGIEEHFYIPMRYYDWWNAVMIDMRLNRFRMGSTGVPLGKPKDSGHMYVEGKLKCEELGLDPKVNLLEEHYK